MVQFVDTVINIDGKSINQFSSLTLSQNIYDHHTFSIVCPAEAADGTTGNIFNASKNWMGSPITIEITTENDEYLQFAGVVLQVETTRHSGHMGNVIITGSSPTILMDNGWHCKSWEKKTIKNIAQDVLKHFPQNILPATLSPINSEILSYTVQYKETAWQFLKRLSALYGEWLFYNGDKLIFGAPQGNSVPLIFGSNLSQFNMALQIQPAKFQMMAYDYLNHQVYEGVPAGTASKAGLNDLGKHALQKSESFYGTQPKQWHNYFLTSKKQLDDFVNTRAAMQSSNMVRFQGTSGHPGIQIGSSVNVQGKNVYNQSDETFGEYTVISVTHHCDGQGNYFNNFIAIPSTIKMPPITPFIEPHCETQSAIVTDNNDEKGLGRVRVKFHWMNGSEKSPWLRVTTPHAGGGKGMFLMPEKGEEVIVGFEGDSAIKPYIIGSVYNGKEKCSFANGGNDVKALQSRSGNKVVMDDKDKSIHIADAEGNSITLDGKGNIIIHSSTSITLACGGKDSVASSITLDNKGNISLIGKDITVVASSKVALGAGSVSEGSFDGSGLSFDPNNIAIGAKQKCDVAGGSESNFMGKTVKVMADGETFVSGSKVNIN